MNDFFKQLYLENVKGTNPSDSSGNQYTGFCPFHDDANKSFSFNIENGLCKCFTGCFEGNAYQFAKEIRHKNPKQFINGNTNSVILNKPKPEQLNFDCSGFIKPLIENLKNHPEIVPECWNEKLVLELQLGYKDGSVYYPHHNSNGDIIAVHEHKGRIHGKGTSKWYLCQYIDSYDISKPLYICEGEKDTVTLKSIGSQVISNTTGCNSIPRDENGNYDLRLFKKFKEVIIVYDHDDSGRNGAVKLALEILKVYPASKVKIAQWDSGLPEKFDVTDSFLLDYGESFDKAVVNAKNIEPKRLGFKVFTLKDFLLQEFEPTNPIIRNMVYKSGLSVLAGDTGVGKSWVGIQMALSIGSGNPLFGHFETTQSKVMLIQFENENYDIRERFSSMLPSFINNSRNNDWRNNVFVSVIGSEDELFIDNWKKVESTLIEYKFKDGVIIIDNFYTSTDKEIQNNKEVAELLREIIRIKKKFQLTIILIAHTNKGVEADKNLYIDQIQGGKTFTNNVSNVVQMHTSSTSVDLKIVKITKGGRSQKNELQNIPFKLTWNDISHTFSKGAIIQNISVHFQEMKDRWEVKLIREMASYEELLKHPTFSRKRFRDFIPETFQPMEEYKITRVLNRLVDWGFVRKIKHNTYELVMDEINEQGE